MQIDKYHTIIPKILKNIKSNCLLSSIVFVISILYSDYYIDWNYRPYTKV